MSFFGLFPSTWIAVGAGYSREDVKAELLCEARAQKQAFRAEVVTRAQDLAARVAGVSSDRVLAKSSTRQEFLRWLVSVPAIRQHLPEFNRLRRQATFWERLDRAMQSGRLAVTNSSEEEAFEDKLVAQLGPSVFRAECRVLATAYETVLSDRNLWDAPMLYRKAIELLSSGDRGAQERLGSCSKLLFLSTQEPEGLEQLFWERLSLVVETERIRPEPSESEVSGLGASIRWVQWHTLDDAAEGLAEELSQVAPEEWEKNVVLIPDHPGVRRSLRRAFQAWGVAWADPTDPTQLQWDENVKAALLPLRLVARDFDKKDVFEWLRIRERKFPDVAALRKEIQGRGVRRGVSAYQNGVLESLGKELEAISRGWGSRLGVREAKEAHLSAIESFIPQLPTWVSLLVQTIWESLEADLRQIEQDGKKAPVLLWQERFQLRLNSQKPPPEGMKARGGVRLFRLNQVLFQHFSHEPGAFRLHVFGLPQSHLSEDAGSIGDYWFSARERELLAGTYPIRSGAQVRQERTRVLQAWFTNSRSVSLWDARLNEDGGERAGIGPALLQLGLGEVECKIRGAHPRWTLSYGLPLRVQSQKVELESVMTPGHAVPEVSATELESYSQCGLLGLAQGRWRLRDEQEADADLWPQYRGILLHKAVELLLAKKVATAEDALELAWDLVRPRGLLKSPRLEKQIRSSLLETLEKFLHMESAYQERSGAKPFLLEGSDSANQAEPLRLEFSEGTVVGRSDRIDEVNDGLFVMDYKSSAQSIAGRDMVEKGYRLQLPFYALAAARRYEKPVLGAQFVELTTAGARSRGILFSEFNGKGPGKLTNSMARASLFKEPPEEIWARCELQIRDHVKRYVGGVFEAKPKNAKDCDRCRYQDLCGKRRLIETEETVEESSGGAVGE